MNEQAEKKKSSLLVGCGLSDPAAGKRLHWFIILTNNQKKVLNLLYLWINGDLDGDERRTADSVALITPKDIWKIEEEPLPAHYVGGLVENYHVYYLSLEYIRW